jgi:hypothetical protein
MVLVYVYRLFHVHISNHMMQPVCLSNDWITKTIISRPIFVEFYIHIAPLQNLCFVRLLLCSQQYPRGGYMNLWAIRYYYYYYYY